MAKRTATRHADNGDEDKVEQQSAAPAEFGVFTPPETDDEFMFDSVDTMPEWADKGWAGVKDDGSGTPVLRVPGMQYPNAQPYHTNVANVGDVVKWDSAQQKLLVIQPSPKAA